MPRAGKLLERVVASIENIIDRGIVQVKSPAYLVGRLSGSTREVDVALIGSVGSNEVLTIIEVRDRKKAQGTEWIEQLSTKKRDVGAHMAVAVSSGGFTAGATALADQEGIQLRTIAEVDADNLLQRCYWPESSFNVIFSRSLAIEPLFEGQMLTKLRGEKWSVGEIFEVGSLTAITGLELANQFPPSIWELAEISDNTIRILFRLKLPRDNGFALELRRNSGAILIPQLGVDFLMKYRTEKMNYREAREYSAPSGLSYAHFGRKPGSGRESRKTSVYSSITVTVSPDARLKHPSGAIHLQHMKKNFVAKSNNYLRDTLFR